MQEKKLKQQPQQFFQSPSSPRPTIHPDMIEEHNFMFSLLTPMISKIHKASELQQKQAKQGIEQNPIETHELKEYVTQQTNAFEIIQKLENLQAKLGGKLPSLSQGFSLIANTTIYWAAFYMFLQSATSILGAIFLNKITDILKNYSEDVKLQAISFLIMLVLLNFLKTYSQIKFNWYDVQFKSRSKVLTQYLVYKKILITKQFSDQKKQQTEENKEEQKTEEEQEKEKLADINNLISVDADMLQMTNWVIQNCWSNTLMIFVIMGMLYWQLGDAIFKGLLIFGGAILFNFFCMGFMQYFYAEVLKSKDKRVSLIKDVINCMKSIKYLSWEKVFKDKIMQMRKQEFTYLSYWKFSDSFMQILWNCLRLLLMYGFLSNYINKGNQLKDTNIFVVIMLFELLNYPLMMVPWALGYGMMSITCFNRVNAYLQEKEICQEDVVKVPQESQKNQILQQNHHYFAQNDFSVDIQNVSCKWPVRDLKQQEENKDTKQQNTINNIQSLPKEKSETDFSLSIDKLQIQSQKLTFLIGKIGSGKSALFQSILNEMENTLSPKNKSHIKVKGNIGLVTQNHWLQNASIRENILFGKPYIKEKYEKCIEISQLIPDLETFSNYDMKLIGPQGNNLSGGQKQRICICRALYQDNDIYLFDDIFSSLDAHVAQSVYEKAIKQYLIQQKRKTVVLIVSQYKYLIQDKANSNIIYLENGHIVHNQSIIDNYLQHEYEQQRKQELQKENEEKQHKNTEICTNNNKKEQKTETKKSLKSEDDLEQEKNEEYRDQGNISFKTLFTYIDAMGIFIFIIFILTSLMLGSSKIIVDLWLKSEVTPNDNTFKFIDDHFKNDFQKTYSFFILFTLLISFIKNLFSFLGAQIAGWRLFNRINNTIMFSDMNFFDNNPTGRIINRLSNDVLIVDYELPWISNQFFDSFFVFVCTSGTIIYQIPYMGIFFTICVILIYFFQNQFRPSNRELRRLNSVNEGKVLTLFNEVIQGVNTIRAFSKEQVVIQDFATKIHDTIISKVLSEGIFVWMQSRMLMLSNIIIVSLVLFCCYVLQYSYNDIQSTTLIFTLSYTMILSNFFFEVISNLCQTEQRFVSIERFRQYFEQNKTENLDKIPQKTDQNVNQFGYFQDLNSANNYLDRQNFSDSSIVFQNVNLSYETDKQPYEKSFALKNFNLEIKKGEKIAFVGRTGSGKTSILNVLFNMYPIEEEGTILVNGKSTGEMSLTELRQNLSIIPQFGFMFNSTLKDNLDPENRFSKEQLMDLIGNTGLTLSNHKQQEKSNLDCESSQNQIDLDFEIEESGKNLSNGEKQIVNFLRIMIRDQDILCLDEATSNMDPKTDALLHDKLFEIAKNKTLLVITHRLENIEKFDRVIVMEEGEIIEQGHITELKQNKNGFFNKLLSHQI